jgi:hypothetical protein
VLLDGHRPHLDKGMLVMLVFPVALMTVPIALVIVMPIFIIPIVVPSIVISQDWIRRYDKCSHSEEQ